VGGVATLAIARGTVCELTRLAPVDLEVLASRMAEREAIPAGEARTRLLGFGQSEEVDERALAVLDAGLAELADDLRNTIEFHSNSATGDPVAEVVLSGAAALIPNFADVLEQRMGMPVRTGAPNGARPDVFGELAPARASIAAGLAVTEVHA
jgi:Tfp pilus assembly PilM family ATPase